VFGETDLKEAFEENGAGLHTVQPENLSGFTEARLLMALFSAGSTGNKN